MLFHGRRVPGARLRRTRQSPLGPLRTGHDRGPHPGHRTSRDRPGGGGGHGLPDPGRGGGHGRRDRHAGAEPASRRGRLCDGLHAAAPGRPAQCDRCNGQSSRRRPPSGPPIWPGWRPVSGPRWTRWAGTGSSTSRRCPAPDRTGRGRRLRGLEAGGRAKQGVGGRREPGGGCDRRGRSDRLRGVRPPPAPETTPSSAWTRPATPTTPTPRSCCVTSPTRSQWRLRSTRSGNGTAIRPC